jgi:hypothetical protein
MESFLTNRTKSFEVNSIAIVFTPIKCRNRSTFSYPVKDGFKLFSKEDDPFHKMAATQIREHVYYSKADFFAVKWLPKKKRN